MMAMIRYLSTAIIILALWPHPATYGQAADSKIEGIEDITALVQTFGDRGTTGALESIANILSLVALAITVIGFFASLKFYRDGTQMQTRANNVLAKIEGRTSALQTQVGGILDRTLDAVLGRSTAAEAGKQQSRLLSEEPLPADLLEPSSRFGSDPSIARKFLNFYGFRRMRFSDVAEPNTKAVFNLGSGGSFNMFDGPAHIVFLGFFIELDAAEIVARTRMLFGNIDIAYESIEKADDSPVRDRAKVILDQISIEIYAKDDIDAAALLRKLDEFQPKKRRITVAALKLSDIDQAIAEEYRRMEP